MKQIYHVISGYGRAETVTHLALHGVEQPGIRGLAELEKRVDSGEMAVAFSLYPVSIEQLFNIADSGNVMPPKSTWFEPKLRDGLLTHLTSE